MPGTFAGRFYQWNPSPLLGTGSAGMTILSLKAAFVIADKTRPYSSLLSNRGNPCFSHSVFAYDAHLCHFQLCVHSLLSRSERPTELNRKAIRANRRPGNPLTVNLRRILQESDLEVLLPCPNQAAGRADRYEIAYISSLLCEAVWPRDSPSPFHTTSLSLAIVGGIRESMVAGVAKDLPRQRVPGAAGRYLLPTVWSPVHTRTTFPPTSLAGSMAALFMTSSRLACSPGR